MKKRGEGFFWSVKGAIILGVAILILMLGIYLYLKGDLGGMMEYIKKLFTFGR